MSTNADSNIGAMIKIARTEMKLGVREAARQMNISPTYLSRMENGFELRPSDEIIARLSDVLKLDAKTLYLMSQRIPKCVIERVSNDPELLSQMLALM